MNKVIFGIGGRAGSGKDTVASMINYILQVGTTKANYKDWLINEIPMQQKCKNHTTHFADPLKDSLSIIYNIPRSYFDNREYKESKFYSLDEHKFLSEDKLTTKHKVITSSHLKYDSIPMVKKLYNNKHIVITLRDLMQYYGTNVCRNNLGNNIWIESTMKRVNNILGVYDYCIVADVRFENECNSINSIDDEFLYGVTIKVNRDVVKLDHESEECVGNYTFEIDNTGSKMQLFYNVLDIIQSVL